MFGLFKNPLKKREPVATPDSAILVFVRNLCEKCPEPSQNSNWSSGYIYSNILSFHSDGRIIEVKLWYNSIRMSWEIDIWNTDAGFLFYGRNDKSAIHFLVSRFDIMSDVRRFMDNQKEEDRAKKIVAQELKTKFGE